jgi:hypothetical protein
MEIGKQILAGLYQPLLDQVLPDPLYIHDHQGRFYVVNDKACESVGYTREELLTMNVTDLEQDFDLPRAQSEWAKIEPGRKLELQGHQCISDYWKPTGDACTSVAPRTFQNGLVQKPNSAILRSKLAACSKRWLKAWCCKSPVGKSSRPTEQPKSF